LLPPKSSKLLFPKLLDIKRRTTVSTELELKLESKWLLNESRLKLWSSSAISEKEKESKLKLLEKSLESPELELELESWELELMLLLLLLKVGVEPEPARRSAGERFSLAALQGAATARVVTKPTMMEADKKRMLTDDCFVGKLKCWKEWDVKY